jgi:transcriptional regulator with XRE-family HTH domain
MKRIRDLREMNNLTQKKVAEYLNVSQATYARYETGEIKIDVDSIIKLANLYKVTSDYILGLSDKK